MNKEFDEQIRRTIELCQINGVAIKIWANGTWEQMGGTTPLYDFRDLMINSKRSLCETIRKLKMDLDALQKDGE